MKHFVITLVVLVACISIFSCSERVICPAYQSAFIHDKATLDKKFSYFIDDSLPKDMFASSKNKFLIIDKISYKKKVRSLNTVPMQTIYPIKDDSVVETSATELMAEYDPNEMDSLANDSTAIGEPWDDKFNVEQEFYLHYFNDILVYPEERALAQEEKEKKEAANATAPVEKEGNFFQRLKNKLFKKKDKTATEGVDGAAVSPEGDEATDEQAEAPPKKKKGLFGKRKKKEKPEESAPVEEEAAPAEDPAEDDGSDDF